jgi:hypothetical protein
VEACLGGLYRRRQSLQEMQLPLRAEQLREVPSHAYDDRRPDAPRRTRASARFRQAGAPRA